MKRLAVALSAIAALARHIMKRREYPSVREFISKLPKDTFLYDRLSNNSYGFWPYFEYFLSNLNRFVNHTSILDRLSQAAPMSLEKDEAWNRWRKFRAAQSEVTYIYLIEKAFTGNVVEIVREGSRPTPDLKVILGNQEWLIEIKAQSGQQHGDKHPRAKNGIMFTPQDESDLRSWLFEQRISLRDGRPMKPKALEAEGKGAHILAAITDIFAERENIEDEVAFICPGSQLIEQKIIKAYDGIRLKVYFFRAEFPLSQKLKNLKEIWLLDESCPDRFIVLSQAICLLEHLRNQDRREHNENDKG